MIQTPGRKRHLLERDPPLRAVAGPRIGPARRTAGCQHVIVRCRGRGLTQDIAGDHRPRSRQPGVPKAPRPVRIDLHGGDSCIRRQPEQQRAVTGGRFENGPAPRRPDPGRRAATASGSGVENWATRGCRRCGWPPAAGGLPTAAPRGRRRWGPIPSWRQPSVMPKVATGRLQRFLQRMGRRRVLAGRHRIRGRDRVARGLPRRAFWTSGAPAQQARHQVG